MDCRRTVITGGVLRSPPSASAAPLTIATKTGVMRHRSRRHSRLYDNYCSDDDRDEYNNNNVSATSAPNITNTTLLVDELEQLRTDNFQLRLRVYNAERRVDKLSEAAALGRHQKKRHNRSDSDDTDDSSDQGESGAAVQNTAAAKATADAAVRTIHDLLTVNRRLLALLAATVSAKAVAVSDDDKRRWRQLQNHIKEYVAEDPNDEKIRQIDEDDHDDEFHDTSASDSETSCRAQVSSATEPSGTKRNVLHSPPPPPPTPNVTTVGADDESAGSEVSRLRGRCRRLERSLQQLVNTELWARNRQISKLEQQRYVTQVADAVQRDRRPTESATADAPPQQQSRSKTGSTVSPPVTKGILVTRSTAETSSTTAATKSQMASSPPTATTITTPPPVLPDYSEVNFFFSCDEEDDDDHQENSAETNTLSSEQETANSNDRGDEQPTRIAAVGAPVQLRTVASNTRKRHCRPHHRQPQQPNKGVGDSAITTTTSSSTESAAEDEADDLSRDDVMTTNPSMRCRTVSGGGGLHRRRRCRPPRRCSICGRCNAGVDAVVTAVDHQRPPPVADAQVQCDGYGDGNASVEGSCNSDRGDGDQLQLLRRELDARRHENGRLYAMLLKLQRAPQQPGDRGKGDGGPEAPSPDIGDSESDLGGSPEPYRQAAQAVRGRIADLLPPLLSMRSISDDDDVGSGGQQRDRPDGAEQQQQQQLLLLNRLRKRIVAYERRELDGGDRAAVGGSEDPSNDAIRRMDRADLVNVALPRALERLRHALVPLLQQRPESVVAAASDRQQPIFCSPAAGGGVGDATDNSRPPLIEDR